MKSADKGQEPSSTGATASISLQTPLKSLRGVGPVVAGGLERLGLSTVADLLNHYPHRWEDYSRLSTIAGLRPGPVTLRARVERLRLSRTARRRVPIVEAILSDDSGTTKAVWFGQMFIMNSLREGEEYYFAGEFAFRAANLALQNPTFELVVDQKSAGRIVPIYPENSLITSKLLSKLCIQVIETPDLLGQIAQVVPEEIIRLAQLLPKSSAIRELHAPTSMRQLELAQRSLGYEELFILITAGLVIRAQLAAEEAMPIPFQQRVIDDFLTTLPYKLTDAQRLAAWQIFEDLKQGHPMHRLLQGDVGSGKTVVALMAASLAAAAGAQTALLVPTEILARQHIASAARILEPLGIKPQLLVAGLTSAEKATAYQGIADGSVQVVIGTHSLLNDSLEFHRLALIIIDEQHRFGVAQRDTLLHKGTEFPHLLAMTATPIPRSLTHIIYGDMDVSVIDELPPGRVPTITKLFLEIERANAYAQIEQQIEQGRQVFVICPRIDSKEEVGEVGQDSGAKSVKSEYNRLQKTIFQHRRIALLHGRMSSADKEQVMADFAAHRTDILIATSVVEVGVDVPNATVMMIEDADRFGLAALHQLRGRVGRAGHQSYCFLFTRVDAPLIQNRLRALERTNDGFRLAQIDLETRGAGELFGTRQHGHGIDLRMASLADTRLIAAVQAAAKSWLAAHDLAEAPALAGQIDSLQQVTVLD